MKRLILAVLALGLLGAGLTGCRASADVDPHGATPIQMPR